ncbi:MAG: 23S rRNA (guanosine(2251)-2'-O)-methyltransferase RlmB [Flavobacteriaceae bacterium]|nr:23S rRNA (guanosine(2251)-2'-O)-methyltransferase RlmB [Bacteroidota bacterium]MSP09626.1 23S rRNA (guanosine(2251)-2'-O)-methyltransferase RlmB [Flavobacteriaceae bacterium]
MEFRKKEKDAFVYGIHPVLEALQSGRTVDKVWLQEGVLQGQLKDLLPIFRSKNIIWKQVPLAKLNALVKGNHQGVVISVSAVDFADLDTVVAGAFEAGEDPFILILDGVTDVRNFGAIARTAACAGAHGILVPEKGSAPLSSDAVRTSAGALMKIPVCRTQSLYGSIKMLKNSGVKIVGATEKTAEALFDADLTGPIAIVMGDEETGLSIDTWKLCDAHVQIPLSAKGVGSLNVSVAAGVITYEVVRQRTK